MSQGPVTESYGKDTKEVVAILNEVLATEIVCWMRYSRHAISAAGINWLADDDATTRRLIEDIPAEEDEHADDIVDLLGT
jgi:bacterioferritin (cytochrome b1)